jgi:thermitase
LSRALTSLLVLIVVLGVAAPVAAAEPGAAAAAPAGEFIPGEVVVTFRDGAAADSPRLRGLTRVADLGAAESGGPTLVSTNGRPVGEVIAKLQADPSVLAVEPNYVVHLANEGEVAVAVDDPKTGDQYSLDVMRVRHAWSRVGGSANVIAVLDTGVMASHPDLAGRVLKGYDFVNDDWRAADDNGHGTWVAGIIAATSNDGYGIAGVSRTAKILPVKIMNRSGTGSTADLLAAIRWSADKGADVINMSVGGFPYSQMMQDAVYYAWGKGAVLVGAAGNNRREETYYPASFDRVISVSATQVNDEFSNWSSYGPKVDVSAPGSSVLTTNCYTCTYADHDSWGSHTFISGTSFATPNVAGVVALIRARYPHYTPTRVASRLYSTVDDLGYRGWDRRYGRGRVNALRAVGGISSSPSRPRGDAFEGNNWLSATAPRLTRATTVRPTIYPAGDVDVFTVDAPRAGRLDVRVTGVIDTRAYPWNKSGLPVDPIVELYTSSGAFIKRVDNEWEGGTEVARLHVSRRTRVIVRVRNWYPSGSRTTYSITPTYVDTVAPVATIVAPLSGATEVSRFVHPVVRFNEAVRGVSADAIKLRDAATDTVIAADVVYDRATRRARVVPHDRLAPARSYRVTAGPTIKDGGGNPIAVTRATFTTGTASFADTAGNAFESEIEWLVAAGITRGCSTERFCPRKMVTRGQMAAFLARAFELPPSDRDYFRDDSESTFEDEINRLAHAGLTTGCGRETFCPGAVVSRAQMATFLARAIEAPPTSTDFFNDDDGNLHERSINRLAAAGIVHGCGQGRVCPAEGVTRGQMAALLYRALADGS